MYSQFTCFPLNFFYCAPHANRALALVSKSVIKLQHQTRQPARMEHIPFEAALPGRSDAPGPSSFWKSLHFETAQNHRQTSKSHSLRERERESSCRCFTLLASPDALCAVACCASKTIRARVSVERD